MNAQSRFVSTILITACLIGLWGCTGSGSASSSASDRRTRASLEEVLRADEATQRAKLLMASGRIREALNEFERAVEINPGAVDAYIGIGNIYKDEGDMPKAERSFRTAAKVGPDVFEAQYAHGLILQLMHRFQESIRAYLRALQIDPRDFDANMNLALAFVQAGQPQQGLPYAIRATKLNPQSGPAFYNLGVVYSALNRHTDAITSYRRASEYMGTSPQLLMGIADSQSALKQYGEAARTLERLIASEPSADAYHRLGTARFRNREYDAAMKAFRNAIEMDDTHYPALNGIAVCLLNQYLWSDKSDTKALDAAVRAMRRSLRIKRDQPQIIELLTRFG